LEFGEAKFQSLMRQREGFHICRRHVFHAQLALRMKYRQAAVRKRHYMPHSSGARARAKFQFTGEIQLDMSHVLM